MVITNNTIIHYCIPKKMHTDSSPLMNPNCCIWARVFLITFGFGVWDWPDFLEKNSGFHPGCHIVTSTIQTFIFRCTTNIVTPTIRHLSLIFRCTTTKKGFDPGCHIVKSTIQTLIFRCTTIKVVVIHSN